MEFQFKTWLTGVIARGESRVGFLVVMAPRQIPASRPEETDFWLLSLNFAFCKTVVIVPASGVTGGLEGTN